jgi:uncharacterized membrane protein YGL010W
LYATYHLMKNNIYRHSWVAPLTVLLATHFLSLWHLPEIGAGATVRLTRLDYIWIFFFLFSNTFDRWLYFVWSSFLVAIKYWIKDLLIYSYIWKK